MLFIIIVCVVTALFFIDWLLTFSGRRILPFLDSKTVIKLKERIRQLNWIKRKRKARLSADELNRLEHAVAAAEKAVHDKKSLSHQDLSAVVIQVNTEFKALEKYKQNGFIEFIESIWVVVLIALLIRSFLFESFRVPTGSMVPSIYIGDMLFVNKYVYGLRPPFTKVHFLRTKTPTRGEVIVFIYPQDPKYDFVKRVIGLPGDIVKLDGRRIFVNGKEITREKLKDFKYFERSGSERETEWFTETNQDGVSYPVLYSKDQADYTMGCLLCDKEFTVPDDSIFAMGDNRDVSSDSRYWGFVPMENLKGRASMIWFSVSAEEGLHPERIGEFIE